MVYIALSYWFVKTYQLNSYDVKRFITSVFELNLSFGDKSRLKFTKRIIRFFVCLFLVCFGIFFIINYFVISVWAITLCYIIFLLLMPFIVLLVHFLLLPIEIIIKKTYILKAKKKLSKYQIIKIGITGSYGKTSTKNILTAMLEKEYKVCTTPQNYNTEMGITKTILQN